jgi:Acetyltransferase (GNAT) domain
MDYSIERLSASNIPRLVSLYNHCFNVKVAKEFLIQKYNTVKLGAQHIGFLALSQNLPVAFYAVIPCIILLDGEEILAAQSTDTMTHPHHRKKGLFLTLAQKTYDLARRENIRFIFGFPNQRSLPGFAKLNWSFGKDPMKLFRMSTNSFSYARIIFKSRLLSRIYLKAIELYLRSDSNLAQHIFEGENNCLKHDTVFVSYKEHTHTFFISIGNTGVWLRIDGSLKIGYVKLHARVDLSQFLKQLRRLATILGCSKIVFITGCNSKLFAFLQPQIHPADAFPVGFLNLTGRRIDFEKIGFEYCDIDIF